MHLAHCLKASVTSPRWPFFHRTLGFGFCWKIRPSFSVYLHWRWRTWQNESYLCSLHFGYLCSPGSFSLSCKRRSRLDLHLKLLHLKRSVDKDPSWVGVFCLLKRWSSDEVERGRTRTLSSQLPVDHWASQLVRA